MHRLGALLPAAALAAASSCVQTTVKDTGGFRMQSGMFVSSSEEVFWRDEMRGEDFVFKGIHVAPLRLDVARNGRYATIDPRSFDDLARTYAEVMEEQLADRFTLLEEPGPGVLEMRVTVADVIRSERLRANAGSFRMTGSGLTGEAVLVFEFHAGDHLLAELVSRMGGGWLDRALGGGLAPGYQRRIFDPFADRLKRSMLQTSG